MTNTSEKVGNNNLHKLQGKVAIVTGSSKGIGAAIAKALANAGAAVVVNYASSKEGADKVVNEIIGKGGKAVAIKGNVSQANDVTALFAQTKTALGTPDLLVNAAGVYQFGPIEAVTESDFHRQFNINVLGTILTTQESLKYFGENGGSIINISSIAGTHPPAYGSVYSATKSAVDTITRSLAAELGGRKIRVNAVSPGMTETEGLHSVEGLIGGPFEQQMVGNTPLGRMGQPGDITGAIVFLASDDASWITGENIRVAGGLI